MLISGKQVEITRDAVFHPIKNKNGRISKNAPV